MVSHRCELKPSRSFHTPWPRRLICALAAAALTLAASQAWAAPPETTPEQGKHCAGQPGSHLLWHQLLVAQVNPLGVEHSGRLGVCTPFLERPGLLFGHSNIESGVVHHLAPAYGHLGGYLQVAPFSFLVLRAELAAVQYWPFPFDRAGYFPRSGYDDDSRPEVLPPEDAQSARGWNANLIVQPRVRVAMGSVSLLALSVFSYERWVIGTEDYYVNVRRELILAEQDSVLANEGMAMVEIPLTDELDLRVGGYDALRYGLGSEQLSNSAGALAMVHWAEVHPAVRNLTPFVRVGGYSHHPFRAGQVALFAGALGTFDLAHLP